MTFTPADGSKAQKWKVFDYKGSGVGMAMYNTDEVGVRVFHMLFCLVRPFRLVSVPAHEN